MMQLYLLGYPLGHSVSPAMQNAALEACGLHDWRYASLALPPDRLSEVLTALRTADCAGANITIPYKETLLPFVDEVSQTAQEIGAINTIIHREGKLIGENTDAVGFLQSLAAYGCSPQGARAAILGAGGAARAVAWALGNAGVAHLALYNRTPARTELLAARVRAGFPALAVDVEDLAALANADLIVNATSVGMWPHVDASPLAPSAPFRPGAIVFDLVYNPRETRLLREAAEAGAQAIGGLEMLVHQGARAFELWTGQPAPVAVMQRAAQTALAQLHQEE
ncbi:MAG: shikimate dehydrogenase [Anaerolineae bacterium]